MDVYQQIFFTTLSVAFGLLHFIMFLYNKRLKSNMYFATFLFSNALNIFFDFQESLASNGPDRLVYLRLHRAFLPLNPIFMLLFLYSIFQMKISKQFWLIAVGLMVTGALAVLDPIGNFSYIQIFLIIVFVEASRISSLAIYHKKDGAFLIGAGCTLLFLFSFYDVLMDLNFIQPFYNIANGYPYGFVCLILGISIYLSREFARINKKIIAQGISAKDMETKQRLLREDTRKAKELEEARNLQLSMLPQCITELNGLEICFSMKTATEVGGDYYDYIITNDSVLTLAIGDATAHGMKAGILVSIMKSLFLTQNPSKKLS